MSDNVEDTSQIKAVHDAWKPIETAPKDGTLVILFSKYKACRGFVGVYFWNGESWLDNVGFETELATHWMPLPATLALELVETTQGETVE